jgi:uncharacterized protein YndB with AHSA1/START domain
MTMNNTVYATASIVFNAPASRVWDALTDPAQVKQYLFGTEMSTTWEVGGAITYKGVWQGKSYEDKGVIVQLEPRRLLVSTYWSPLSGTADLPENYKTVRYELSGEGGGTKLTITQDGNRTQEEADHSAGNWKTVLDGMKKLLEG